MKFLRTIITLLLFLMISFSAFSADLYLINISGEKELERARSVIPFARGVINDRFIVELDKAQRTKLISDHLSIELIVENATLGNIFFASRFNKKNTSVPLSVSPLYESGNDILVELSKGGVDVLAREGFLIHSLSEREIPLNFKPQIVPVSFDIDYPTDSVADLVSRDSLYSYDTRLEDFYSRFILFDSNSTARIWLRNKFLEFGYTDVSLQTLGVTSDRYGYDLVDYPVQNVLCYKQGTENPDKLIVVGGHFDSFSWACQDGNINAFAPGADDNASGTAAVLELARIFKDIEFKKSVLFTSFNAEEWGLFGAYHLAEVLDEDSVDVQFMLNFDMIANEEDVYPEVNIFAGWNNAYYDLFADAAQRVTDLIPIYAGDAASSDDYAFYEYGFNSVCIHETDFNDNIHGPNDISFILDFDYAEKLVRTAAAGLAVADASPDPIVCEVYDVGDGQSLHVNWENDCRPGFDYEIWYGTNINSLVYYSSSPEGNCSADINGLVEGYQYYIGIKGVPGEGYPPIGVITASKTPLTVPRSPSNFTVEPDSIKIIINWEANGELDLDYYKLLRKVSGEEWSLYDIIQDNTQYIDSAVENQIYYYRLLAVDNDGYESDSSEIAYAAPANFEGGILLVDETQTGGENPTPTEQAVFFQMIFGDSDFTTVKIDSADEALTRSTAGQYLPIFWIDDDRTSQLMGGSIDSLIWYFGYETDFFLAGWRTIVGLTGNRYFYPGSFYYDHLGLSYISECQLSGFIGAKSSAGWPELVVRPDAPNNGRLDAISIFETSPQAEIIYTYNSINQHPYYHGKPVGVAFNTYKGKRVVIGFPLYYLTDESAEALIARAIEYFAEESVMYGDVNKDWMVNIFDITYLISYLYMVGPAPLNMNNGDVNSDCVINIFDVTYLITYLYKDGPEPTEGCVE